MHFSTLLISMAAMAGILNATPAFSQQKVPLSWSENSLNWKDFRHTGNTAGYQKAFSSVSISYSAEMKNDRADVQFSPHFIQEDSWVLAEDTSSLLLIHEQRLFDLVELYARKMRERVDQYFHENNGKASITETMEEVRATYREMTNEMLTRIQLYNSETNYGKNLAMQWKWNRKIDLELAQLSSFTAEK
ncbi:MAG: hypothetical protein IT223_11280 [Crocinitomicaceae bacterium]|nr:hypothetical protein [Crocinitomicaceae bacterium]